MSSVEEQMASGDEADVRRTKATNGEHAQGLVTSGVEKADGVNDELSTGSNLSLNLFDSDGEPSGAFGGRTPSFQQVGGSLADPVGRRLGMNAPSSPGKHSVCMPSLTHNDLGVRVSRLEERMDAMSRRVSDVSNSVNDIKGELKFLSGDVLKLNCGVQQIGKEISTRDSVLRDDMEKMGRMLDVLLQRTEPGTKVPKSTECDYDSSDSEDSGVSGNGESPIEPVHSPFSGPVSGTPKDSSVKQPSSVRFLDPPHLQDDSVVNQPKFGDSHSTLDETLRSQTVGHPEPIMALACQRDVYAGDCSVPLEDYLTHFQSVCYAHNIRKESAGKLLSAKLRGKALAVLHETAGDSQFDIDVLIGRLRERFGREPREGLASRFLKRTRKPNETVREYARDLETMAKKSFNSMPDKELDKFLLDRFVDGLNPELLQSVSCVGLCRTFDEAVCAFAGYEEMSSDQKVKKAEGARKPFACPLTTTNSAAVDPVELFQRLEKGQQEGFSSLGEHLRSMKDSIESLVKLHENNQRNGGGGRSGGRRRVVCYNCGSVGHYQYQCRRPRRNQGDTADINNTIAPSANAAPADARQGDETQSNGPLNTVQR